MFFDTTPGLNETRRLGRAQAVVAARDSAWGLFDRPRGLNFRELGATLVTRGDVSRRRAQAFYINSRRLRLEVPTLN